MPFVIAVGEPQRPRHLPELGVGRDLGDQPVVMLVTIVVFVLAVLLPFPHDEDDE